MSMREVEKLFHATISHIGRHWLNANNGDVDTRWWLSVYWRRTKDFAENFRSLTRMTECMVCGYLNISHSGHEEQAMVATLEWQCNRPMPGHRWIFVWSRLNVCARPRIGKLKSIVTQQFGEHFRCLRLLFEHINRTKENRLSCSNAKRVKVIALLCIIWNRYSATDGSSSRMCFDRNVRGWFVLHLWYTIFPISIRHCRKSCSRPSHPCKCDKFELFALRETQFLFRIW